jgi:predicted Rossmann fold nucleotide-binding protein DprA/Smf involved in DNA uptake
MIGKKIAIVGSRDFKNYAQLSTTVEEYFGYDDEFVSGGAIGADSMAQRFTKEVGGIITIVYPKWNPNGTYDPGAGFKRNGIIVNRSDIVLAFYSKDAFQKGGTANSAEWARKLGKELYEFKEE